MADFPNSVTAKASAAGHSRASNATIGAVSGASATDIAAAIAAKGVPIIPTPAALMADTTSYTGELPAGIYTRASFITLLGPGITVLLSASITVATGTADFSQGGVINNLAPGSIIDKPYAGGYTIDDFSLVVDAASTVYIEIRGN